MCPTTLRWKRHVIAALGIAVDCLDKAIVAEGSSGGVTYFVQTSGPLQLAVRAGPGQNLRGWRRLYQSPRVATFGGESTLTVCGSPAARQEVTVEERPATGGFAGVPVRRDVPPTTHVAVSFRVRELPVLAVWSVEAARRDELRADEDHFFTSLCCL